MLGELGVVLLSIGVLVVMMVVPGGGFGGGDGRSFLDTARARRRVHGGSGRFGRRCGRHGGGGW